MATARLFVLRQTRFCTLTSEIPVTLCVGFGPEGAAAIQAVAPHIGPHIGELVEQTYEKLLQFDATAHHFVPRQADFEGELPTGLDEVSSSHAQIQFRKDHLSRYFVQLIGRNYDPKIVMYLDAVGRIHTPDAGNSEIDVPLVQMNALMELLSDTLIELILESPLEHAVAVRTVRAFNKLL